MNSRKWTWFALAPFAVLGILLFVAVGGEVVRQLWNWLLPPLFGWPRITFWQAVGLLALCRILFGGTGRHGSSGPLFRGRITPRCRQALKVGGERPKPVLSCFCRGQPCQFALDSVTLRLVRLAGQVAPGIQVLQPGQPCLKQPTVLLDVARPCQGIACLVQEQSAPVLR